MTRAVKGVSSHGQIWMARAGNRNKKALIDAASTPTATMPVRTPFGSSSSLGVTGASYLRFAR